MAEITGYELSRNWFDWCFENTEKVNPNHSAIYFFAIEHCNRLGWKEKFGMPTQMTMDAVGIKNWRTYSKAFNDLVDWGFFKVIEKSKNQYSATVIAIVKNTKAHTKALSKATQKHIQKQSSSKGNSIVVIDKPINYITKEPINLLTIKEFSENILKDSFVFEHATKIHNCTETEFKEMVSLFFVKQKADGTNWDSLHECKKHFNNWLNKYTPKKKSINSQVQFDPIKR